jgi:hypothetical protein
MVRRSSVSVRVDGGEAGLEVLDLPPVTGLQVMSWSPCLCTGEVTWLG